MSIRTEAWPEGTPCWVELISPDLPRSKAIYGPAFEWDFAEDPSPDANGYVICTRGGQPVAGMMRPPLEAPPSWSLYFATDDVDATLAKVLAKGGASLVEPMDIMSACRIAFVQDPIGAVFGIWQSRESIGHTISGEPGSFTWCDGYTTDVEAARDFYSAVFGYDYAPVEGAPEGYMTFALPGGDPIGGIGPVQPGMPSHWLTYFACNDADKVGELVGGADGRVLMPAMDTPWGRMLVLQEPGGPVFAVMQAPNEAKPSGG